MEINLACQSRSPKSLHHFAKQRTTTQGIVMIDLRTERLYPLSKAARMFPGGGKHVSQLHRYRMADENGIHLECVLAGGRLMTSVESMHRYVEAKTNAMNNSAKLRLPIPSDRRTHSVAKAAKTLAAAGI